MKRLLILSAVALALQAAAELNGAMAVVERKDGRAWKASLQAVENGQLVVRLDQSSADRLFKLEDVARLEFMSVPYDSAKIHALFDSADYNGVIAGLAPLAAMYGEYAFLPNNRETDFNLLMQAYYRAGEYKKAAVLAGQLIKNPDPALRRSAAAYQALAVLGLGDIGAAEGLNQKLNDPVSQLYILACIEQARNQLADSIQTAVKLIAEHGNDMDWMPQTELLCAQLYKEMGMTGSAAATARQTARLYKGTNIGAEAVRLQAEMELLAKQPE